jgi:hypothetical protein
LPTQYTKMRTHLWLLKAVGGAALIATLVAFLLVLGVFGLKIAPTRVEETIFGALMVFLPNGSATWWLFRKLRDHYTSREARSVTIAFAILTPVSLAIAMVLPELSGDYAELFQGSRFAIVGAFVGTVVITTILDFLLCLFTLQMTRHIVKMESTQ